MLGYRPTTRMEHTQFGEFALHAGSGIIGQSPVTDFVYKFWAGLEHPTRADIKPALLAKHLDHLVLMDVQGDMPDIHLHTRLIGTFVANYYGEISGKDIHEMANKEAAERIYMLCRNLIEANEPLLTVTPAFDSEKQFLEAIALYLPLYEQDSDKIIKIMVAVDVVPIHKSHFD